MLVSDFIAVWERAAPPMLCDKLIKFIDKSELSPPVGKNGVDREDLSISIVPIEDSEVFQESTDLYYMVDNLLQPALEQYLIKYGALQVSDYVNSEVKLQKTAPCGGFHKFHAENVGENNARRALVWMIYLNDIPENEGETEFLYQKRRIQPKKGTLVIWPAGFTHTHRGNPVYTEDKYIATGWFYFAKKS